MTTFTSNDLKFIHLKSIQPSLQNFTKKQSIERYKNSIAIGSLKSLKTNIEWILWDVKHIIIKTIGGTFLWINKTYLLISNINVYYI